MKITSLTFICQLPISSQATIKTQLESYLSTQGYNALECTEIVQNALSDRLVLLEDIMDIQPFLSV